MAQPVRVMVVDDSSSTRRVLKEALSLDGGIQVGGEAGGGREAILQACDLKPDVVLMDVRMPDMDGVTATRSIINSSPATRIVALTWSDDPSTVRDMLTAGAIGYVVKGGTIDELSSAIRRAATGEAELDQRVLPAAVEDLRRLREEARERREARRRSDPGRHVGRPPSPVRGAGRHRAAVERRPPRRPPDRGLGSQGRDRRHPGGHRRGRLGPSQQ